MVIKIDYSKISNVSRFSALIKILNFIPLRLKLNLLLASILFILSGILEAETIRYLSILLQKVSQIDLSQEINNFTNTAYLFSIFAIGSSITRILIFKINLNLTARICNYLSSEMFKELALRNYESDLTAREEEDINLITWEVTKAGALINNLLIVASAIFISIFIFISISHIGINYIFTVIFIFLSFYITLAYFIKNQLRINSKLTLEANRFVVKSVQEVSCLRSEINLGLNPIPFIKDFQEVDKQGRDANALSQFLGILPRYLIEGLALGSAAILLSFLYSQQKVLYLIPILGTLGFSFQRLLPNIQQIFYGWSFLNSQGDSLIEVNKSLDKLRKKESSAREYSNKFNPLKIKDWNSIELRNISYDYKFENKKICKVFYDLSLEIIKGDKVAIYGESGSGKSTLTKLISGLLKPNSGEIYLDKKNIQLDLEARKKLRGLIAYVPQQTQILNKSIFDNLFLDVERRDSYEKSFLEKIIKCCLLEEFISSQPNGMSTILGFRGKSISGGQKQRLAIARALLLRKKILILDEATSSLDKNTELKILDNILNFSDKLTIIHVTHNLETLSKFSKMIKVENNQITKIKY